MREIEAVALENYTQDIVEFDSKLRLYLVYLILLRQPRILVRRREFWYESGLYAEEEAFGLSSGGI